MKDIEIVVFQDKSWVRLTEYQKLQEENEQLRKYCKELEAGFLNYKKNYKTKRQKVFDLETRVKNSKKENQQLKQKFEKAKDIIKNLIDTLEAIDGEQTRELKAVKEAELILKGE